MNNEFIEELEKTYLNDLVESYKRITELKNKIEYEKKIQADTMLNLMQLRGENIE